MYVPSLPSIATSLHILKSSAALTITAYLLGMAISQFFYGSISDAYGRKKTLLISSLVCLAGNIICMVSHHFATLVVGRVIQGAGAGASVSMCLAIARDVYEGPTLARAFSILFAFYFAVFGCAPIVGGYLEHYLNWRYNFVILTIYFAIQFFWVLLIYQETYVNTGTHQRLSLKTSLLNYWQLIKSRIFVGNLLACTLTYCGLFAYIAITPFLFQKEMGLNAVEYGWLGIFIAAALVTANVVGGQLVKKFGMHKPNFVLASAVIIGSVVMFVLALVGFSNVWVVILPFSVFILGIGMSGVTCAANAFTPFGHIAGSAGAFWTGMQFLILFGTSFVFAHLGAKTQLPFSVTLMILAGSVVLCLLWVIPIKKLGTQTEDA